MSETKPKHMTPWACPKCGRQCEDTALGTKDYDEAIGYYLHCSDCNLDFMHWENVTRTPYCVEVDGQEHEYPCEPVTIVVTVEGGLIQDITKPDDIRVVVQDFDARKLGYDPEDNVKFNEKGHPYWESIW